jgi:hypothetical protein
MAAKLRQTKTALLSRSWDSFCIRDLYLKALAMQRDGMSAQKVFAHLASGRDSEFPV